MDANQAMEWLAPLRAIAESTLEATLPGTWPQMGEVLKRFYEKPLVPSELDLPFLVVKSLGGDPRQALPAATSLLALSIHERMLEYPGEDEFAATVGRTRLINYASSFLLLSQEVLRQSPMPPDAYLRVQGALLQSGMQMAEGRDRKVIRQYRDPRDYWMVLEKTVAARYATAALTGALTLTAEPNVVRAMAIFGHHLGMAWGLQQEMDALETDKNFDPEKSVMAVLYGLEFSHNTREELLALLENEGGDERIQALLNGIDVQAFLNKSWREEANKAKETLTQHQDILDPELLLLFLDKSLSQD